jgi:hypothetical protein
VAIFLRRSAPFTTRLLLKLFAGLAALGLETVDLVIRKIVHLGEYFVFSIRLMRVLNNRSALSRSGQKHGA